MENLPRVKLWKFINILREIYFVAVKVNTENLLIFFGNNINNKK